jgi:hypothetical protein
MKWKIPLLHVAAAFVPTFTADRLDYKQLHFSTLEDSYPLLHVMKSPWIK